MPQFGPKIHVFGLLKEKDEHCGPWSQQLLAQAARELAVAGEDHSIMRVAAAPPSCSARSHSKELVFPPSTSTLKYQPSVLVEDITSLGWSHTEMEQLDPIFELHPELMHP